MGELYLLLNDCCSYRIGDRKLTVYSLTNRRVISAMSTGTLIDESMVNQLSKLIAKYIRSLSETGNWAGAS